MKTRYLGCSEVLETYINQATPHNIVITGVVNVAMVHATLIAAVEIIRKENYLLQSTISCEQDYVYFKKLKTEAPIVIDLFHDDNLNIENKMQELISQQLDSNAHPLARVVHVHRKENDVLFLVLQHTISDGVSAMEIFIEILEKYDCLVDNKNDKILKKPVLPSIDDILFNTQISFPQDKFIQYQVNEQSKKKLHGLSTGVLNVKLSVEQSEKTLAICKEYGVSVTSFMCSIFTKIMSVNKSEVTLNELHCVILVNLRLAIGGIVKKNDLGFYSSLIKFLIKEEEAEKDIKAISQTIQEKIKKLLNDGEDITNARNKFDLANATSSSNQLIDIIEEKNLSIVISNVGLIDVDEFNNFKLLDLHISCDMHSYNRTENNIFLCMNSLGKHIYLNLLFCTPHFSRERGVKIKNEFLATLEAL